MIAENIIRHIKTTLIGLILIGFSLLFGWKNHDTVVHVSIIALTMTPGIALLFAKDTIPDFLKAIFSKLKP